MNVELLRKIAAVIQEKPASFDMKNWHIERSCGTTHCIAGWACVLSGQPEGMGATARRLLQLDDIVGAGSRLFYEECWPSQFLPVTSESAAARIEHFISTGGAE